MARTKSAAEPDIAAEAAPEQSTINLDAPQETPAPDLTEAEAAALAHEGEAALREDGETLPDPGEINIPFPAEDVVVPFEKINEIMTGRQTAAQEATEAAKQEQPEDTRQEWDKSVAEIEAEQPPKRRGRPSKAEKEKGDTEAVKPKKAAKQDKSSKPPKEKTAAKEPPTAEKPEHDSQAPVQEAAPAAPPEPREAPRQGEPEQIVHLNLSDLHAFKNHPFQVRDDEEMRAMVESVKDKGVTQPAIVRPREDGGYEMVSGHRRMKASELAGFANMPCIIRNMTDEQAITQMVEDNTNQRENILPSERAKALKMQLEAIKRQGSRGDLDTSGQDELLPAAHMRKSGKASSLRNLYCRVR